MADDGITLGVDLDITGADDGLRLDGVLGKLGSSLEQINRQLVRTELASRKAGAGHGEQEKHAKGLLGAFDRLIDKGLDPFLHKAKEIAEFEFIREGTERLLELPGELADKIKELGEEMFEAAGKSQRMEASFALAFGPEKAEAMLGYVDKLSKVSPIAYDQLEQLGLRLGKMGFEGRAAGKAIEAVSDLAALSGNPAAGADEALSAIERIKSTGRVEGRALRPFGIDEKTMFAELTRETGKGMKTLKKEMETGALDIDTILNSVYTVITQKTGKALGGAGAGMSQLFEFQLLRLKDLPDRFFRGMAKSPALKVLGDKFGEIFDLFNPKGEEGVRIMGALESATTMFANAVATVDLRETGDVIADTIQLVGQFASGIAVLIGYAVKGIDTIEDAWLGLKSLMPGQTGKDAIEQIRQRTFNKTVNGVRNQADADLQADKDAIFEKFMKDNGLQSAKGLADGIEHGRGAVEAAGHRLGRAAHRGTRKELQIESPSRVFADLGEMSSAGYVEGIEATSDAIDQAVGRMFSVCAPKPSSAPGSGGGGGPSIGEVVVHVHVDGGGHDANEVGEIVGEKLEEILPTTLQSAVEQLAAQMGSAK